ncbi:CinA family nicotinamide mononucleotide deamidase-related protein [Pseudenhygromyxa sp. WMMC2535]|uniref:CinA family nicotinamide mononucleotide deamidase-related protein n=1 Tax=Pseudenhygromyxa sp. WMMC2535 TaxID=2712867 RepID=UPI001556B581|nr:CinA family nicotinamide mononucleotide deamidase-related protein [Pseudenhygromyxa sp. WMMC2535]NVB36363.1 CinA family nicotinamide mononucleotide deamidase-related protein [Pseudenhygromyxa sp. WMMC2535]
MSRVQAQLLTIGDELLAGDIIDRHKAWLGQRCRALGIEVVGAATVRDRREEIVAAMTQAASRAQLCLVTGGLGPTTDDLTAQAAASAAGVELERRPELAERLEAFFASRGRALLETNLKQADLPAGAEVLDNPIGTAAGFAVDIQGCLLFAMPGVPREVHKMMREQVEPRISARFALTPVPRRVYRAIGRGESSVQQDVHQRIEAARQRSPGLANVFVHYRARYPEVQLILEATPGPDGAAASAEELASLDPELCAALGRAVFAVGTQDGPAEIGPQLVRHLVESGQTLATAESCTGGGVGEAITAVPGSSAIYLGGVIAYANTVKQRQLGVPAQLLEAQGAVSEPVARAMAEGARAALGSDIAVATTGIAGPGGGSEDKPVGTVDIAVASERGTTYKRLRLFGDRAQVRRGAVSWALKLVWDHLELGHRVD